MKLKRIVMSLIALGVAVPTYAGTAAAVVNSKVADLNAISLRNNDNAGVVDARMKNNWFKAVTLSGKFNIDAISSGRTPRLAANPGNTHEYFGIGSKDDRSNNIVLSTAAVFVDAQFNSWANAHLGLAYNGRSARTQDLSSNALNIEEAYVQIADLARAPWVVQVGRQRVKFGKYNYTDIIDPFTKTLSLTTANAVSFGFVGINGFSANVYAFQPRTRTIFDAAAARRSDRMDTIGASVSYDGSYDKADFSVGVDYINNMGAVDAVGAALLNLSSAEAHGPTQILDKRTGAVAVNGDVAYKMFDAKFRYVGALSSFAKTDLAALKNKVVVGAKVKAFMVEAGVRFDLMNYDSRLSASFQRSNDAASHVDSAEAGVTQALQGLHMSKDRYTVDYHLAVMKNADLGFQIAHDKDYKFTEGGTSATNTIGTVRLAVHFV